MARKPAALGSDTAQATAPDPTPGAPFERNRLPLEKQTRDQCNWRVEADR
jgi:hypothetical protein